MNRPLSVLLTLPEEGDAGPASPAREASGSGQEDALERQIIERAQGGDAAAFGQLYEAHYQAILNYLFHRTLNLAVAEDLTSNTFLNALRGLPKYRHKAAFRAWLYQIASNELRMHWRERKRHPRAGGGEDWEAAMDRIVFSEHEAPVQFECEETMRRYAALHAALRELPERFQTALTLRYFEGLPYDQIAQAMGKRLGTVKSLIHRGLKKLRGKLVGLGENFQP